MPPARAMGSEGGSQTELFQWGATSMADWRRDGYNTTNANYNGGFSMDRKPHHSSREATPWSTTNDTYGKGVARARSEQGGAASLQGSMYSYRSHPGFKREPLINLSADRPSARVALEERLRQRAAVEGSVTSPLGSVQGTPSGSQFSLPPLDPSKYLVAQGTITPNWQRAQPEAETTPQKSSGGGDRDVVSRQPPPPKTGPAKRYMRDTLDRFLRSIPEELRPRTRKRSLQPREAPQVLKIEHSNRKTPALRERDTRTSMSHAVPSPPSTASSCTSSSSASDDGVVDLNQSAYSFRKELEKNGGKQTAPIK